MCERRGWCICEGVRRKMWEDGACVTSAIRRLGTLIPIIELHLEISYTSI